MKTENINGMGNNKVRTRNCPKIHELVLYFDENILGKYHRIIKVPQFYMSHIWVIMKKRLMIKKMKFI